MSEPILPRGWYGRPGLICFAGDQAPIHYDFLDGDTNAVGLVVRVYEMTHFFPWSGIHFIVPDPEVRS